MTSLSEDDDEKLLLLSESMEETVSEGRSSFDDFDGNFWGLKTSATGPAGAGVVEPEEILSPPKIKWEASRLMHFLQGLFIMCKILTREKPFQNLHRNGFWKQKIIGETKLLLFQDTVKWILSEERESYYCFPAEKLSHLCCLNRFVEDFDRHYLFFQ